MRQERQRSNQIRNNGDNMVNNDSRYICPECKSPLEYKYSDHETVTFKCKKCNHLVKARRDELDGPFRLATGAYGGILIYNKDNLLMEINDLSSTIQFQEALQMLVGELNKVNRERINQAQKRNQCEDNLKVLLRGQGYL